MGTRGKPWKFTGEVMALVDRNGRVRLSPVALFALPESASSLSTIGFYIPARSIGEAKGRLENIAAAFSVLFILSG